jgi:hypothetical protein
MTQKKKLTLEGLTTILKAAVGTDEGVDLGGDILDVEFAGLGYDSLALMEAGSRIERPGAVEDTEWSLCRACRGMVYGKRLSRNFHVCPDCGAHCPIPAHERIAQVLGDGSIELRELAIPKHDPLGFVDTKPYPHRLRAARQSIMPGRSPSAAHASDRLEQSRGVEGYWWCSSTSSRCTATPRISGEPPRLARSSRAGNRVSCLIAWCAPRFRPDDTSRMRVSCISWPAANRICACRYCSAVR